MGRTLINSRHFRFKEFGSSSRTENPSISISDSLTDVRLPEELITEILLRLPVKSLLNFKCVSKSWLSLISSPQFIRSHFSKSCLEREYLNHQLLFTIHDPAFGLKQCSLYSALHESHPSTHVFDIEYPSQNPNYPPRIVGIVNGLVCLAINANDLFLWNPVLRKSKHLPSSNDILETRFRFADYGFGYDESNDDYKVVSLLTVYGSEVDFVVEVRVYSLRADSWRRIEDLEGVIPNDDSAIYSNGKIYWSAFEPGESGDSTPTMKIISLDMVTDKYGELQQPDYEPGHFNWTLGVLGERPFVLCRYYDTKKDLWVMDKYNGVERSWSKVVSIPYDEVQRPHQQVLCVLSNGEIVFDSGVGLLVYHSKHKEYRNIELDVGGSSYFKVVAYVESLVWPCG